MARASSPPSASSAACSLWCLCPPHPVAASTTYGCSLHPIAASTTHGCSLRHVRLQPLSPRGCRRCCAVACARLVPPTTYYALRTTLQVLLCWGVCMLLPPDDDYEPQRPRRRKDIDMRAEVVRDDHDEQVLMHVCIVCIYNAHTRCILSCGIHAYMHVCMAHAWGDHAEQCGVNRTG